MAEEFTVHKLNERGMAMAVDIARIFADTLALLDDIVTVGRERALIVTKLQEACFFAKRAIAFNPANQETMYAL